MSYPFEPYETASLAVLEELTSAIKNNQPGNASTYASKISMICYEWNKNKIEWERKQKE